MLTEKKLEMFKNIKKEIVNFLKGFLIVFYFIFMCFKQNCYQTMHTVLYFASSTYFHLSWKLEREGFKPLSQVYNICDEGFITYR